MTTSREGDAAGEDGEVPYVSTGHLPSPAQVQRAVDEAHKRYRSVAEGHNATVYPALARVPSDLFGVCAVGTSGNLYAAGDAGYRFTIMSVAKPFVFALVCQALGPDQARHKLGVNATGLPFNSLAAVERSGDGRTNPMSTRGRSPPPAWPPAPPASSGGGSSTTGWHGSRADPSRSTRRSTPPPRPPTTATAASPTCWRSAAASGVTRSRRSSCTPGRAR